MNERLSIQPRELACWQCMKEVPAERVFEGILFFPALRDIVRDTQSRIAIDQDETAAQLRIGNDDYGVWFLYKLRDRQFDGAGWYPTPLTSWSYDGESDTHDGFAVEESTYWLDPRSPLETQYEEELVRFINNPFRALGTANDTTSLLEWLSRWHTIMEYEDKAYPGYFARQKIPGLRRYILTESTRELGIAGYQELTAVPTWYHIATLYEYLGFGYTDTGDSERMKLLHQLLDERGIYDASERSWVIMLQFWHEKVLSMGGVPEEWARDRYVLRDHGDIVTYPLTPERNVWMSHAL